jgi:hypothetical protein
MFRETTVRNLGLLSGLKVSDELHTSFYIITVTQIVLWQIENLDTAFIEEYFLQNIHLTSLTKLIVLVRFIYSQ